MATYALIPAAGLSQRMGRPKLGLVLDGRTVLRRVLDAVRQAGVNETLVVLGPASAFLRDEAERAGAFVAVLAEQTPDMRATIAYGLARLEATFHPKRDDAFLMLPADHPTLNAEVIAALLKSQSEASGMNDVVRPTLFVPTFQGRRGHPILVAWAHIDAIRALPTGVGLNSYFRQCLSVTQEVAWPTEEILRDLDTPEDFERLRKDLMS